MNEWMTIISSIPNIRSWGDRLHQEKFIKYAPLLCKDNVSFQWLINDKYRIYYVTLRSE